MPASAGGDPPAQQGASFAAPGRWRALWGAWLARVWLLPVGVLLVLPVLAVVAAALQWNAESADIVREMALTVLPDYAWTSLLLIRHDAGDKETVRNISKFAIENARTNTEKFRKQLAEDIGKLLKE